MKKQYEKWIDILNDVSVFMEQYITCEDDEQLIRKLDTVIDGIYNLKKKGLK